MGVFYKKIGGSILSGGFVITDKLGSGADTVTPGKKLLNDNQQFAKVTADAINSGAATNGQRLKANGSGGAAWG